MSDTFTIEQLARNPGEEHYLAERGWFTNRTNEELQAVYDEFDSKFDSFLNQFITVLSQPVFSELSDPELRDALYVEAIRIAGWSYQAGYAVLALVHHDKETPVFISFGYREPT